MADKYLLRFFRKRRSPLHQSLVIRVPADTGKHPDLRFHGNFFSEQLHPVGAFHQCPARRSDRLVADKQNRALPAPQVVLQVMFDSACVTHAAGRDNHLRNLVFIDRPGFLRRYGCPESRKLQRVDPPADQIGGFLVIAVHFMVIKNRCRLNRQGAVHIHRKVSVSADQLLFLDLADKVQHLLCPPDGKGRNDDISAPVERFLEYL